jgi:tetratricopeptide (TPR) repeat protein
MLLNDLGALHLLRGRNDDALRALEGALAAKEILADELGGRAEDRADVIASLSNLAVILFRSGRTDQAERAFRRAIDRQERLLSELTDDPGDAEKRTKQTSNLARLCNNLALFLRSVGRTGEAVEPYRRSVNLSRAVIRLSPADSVRRLELARSLGGLGSTLATLGQKDEPYKDFREAVAILEVLAADWPGTIEYRHELGLALGSLANCLNDTGQRGDALGKYDRAIAILRELVSGTPDAPAIQGDLADCEDACARMLVAPASADPEDINRAIRLATQAAKRSPEHPSHHLTLGLAYFRAGDWRKAISSLERSLSLAAGDPIAGFTVAMAYWQLGEKNQARSLFAKAEAWTEGRNPGDPILWRLRTEASALLGRGDRREPVGKAHDGVN